MGEVSTIGVAGEAQRRCPQQTCNDDGRSQVLPPDAPDEISHHSQASVQVNCFQRPPSAARSEGRMLGQHLPLLPAK